MRRDGRTLPGVLAATLVLLALSGAAAADPARGLPDESVVPRDRAGQARACLVAAAEAEARLGLPPGLLAAVAVTESAAHPFAIGAPGRAHYPADRAAALRLARAAGPGASGGCFQVNIGVHARRDPAWVFDPWASALFAGRMLARHAAATGQDWGGAVSRYAGVAPGSAAARRQRCRVAASLAGLGHAPPRGLGPEGCGLAEFRTSRAKAVLLAARASGPEALAALP